MISPLSKNLFKLIKRIWLGAYRLSTILLNNAKNSRTFINFILADINMLFNAVNWTSFKVVVWIENPARVDDKIDRNWFKNWSSHEFVCVKFPRWLVVNFAGSQIMMPKNSRLSGCIFVKSFHSNDITFRIIHISDGFVSVPRSTDFVWIDRNVAKNVNCISNADLK